MASRITAQRMSCFMLALIVTAPHFRLWADDVPNRPRFSFTLPVEGAVTDAPVTPGTGNNTTTIDEDDGTTIKLPTIPPRRVLPGINPNTPTTSGTGTTTTTPGVTTTTTTTTGPAPTPDRLTMAGIEKSAFPGMTCPLVDNRPNKDLLTAIQALNRVVIVTPQCQNNADMVKISEDAKRMIEAGTSLQTLWNNPETLGKDPQNIATFQGNLGVMISGINHITENLQNNTLLNSQCGQSLMSGTGAIVAISDLIASFAPFALVGASMSPALGAALPFILGFTGVGSVAKIIKNMHDQNTLEMWKSEQRTAVLQNICEFSKIQTRVRFLRLAQSGQLEQVTKEIQDMRRATASALRAQFSDRVFEIDGIRNQALTLLNSSYNTYKKDNQEISSLVAQMQGPLSDTFVCYTAREVVSRAGDAATFPTRAIENLKLLLANEKNTSVAQTSLVNSEERLRMSIKARTQDDTEKGFQECAYLGKAYLDTLNRLVTTTRATILKLAESLDRQLNKDGEFASYRRSQQVMQAEINNMAKVAKVLEQLNLDNAIIDRVEMDAQMAELKRALFGPQGGWRLGRGSSPAMSWLEFIDTQHVRSVTQFKTEMTAIIFDAYALTDAATKGGILVSMEGVPLTDQYGRNIPFALRRDQVQRMSAEISDSEKLKNVTLSIAPVGTDNHRLVCQRLENIWLSWAASVDQLAAEAFFCDNIRDFFDSTTERSLVRRCLGDRDLAGRVRVNAEIVDKQNQLVSLGYRDQALVVSAKLKELTCPMPDVTVMK